MNPAGVSPSVQDSSQIPIARIDAQDEEFVLPMREYFATNGCRVLVNSSTRETVAYHIVVGDYDFVKAFFASREHNATLRLAIVQGFVSPDAVESLAKICKVLLVDPVHLTPNEVIDVFSFFFAGNSSVLDKRRTIHDPAPVVSEDASYSRRFPKASPTTESTKIDQSVHTPAFHETDTRDPVSENKFPVDDEKRIGSIMSDVFGGQQPTARRRRGKKKRMVWAVIGFFILMVCIPFIWYWVSITATVASFVVTAKNLQAGKTAEAKQFNTVASYWLHQSSFGLTVIGFPFRLVGFDEPVRAQERIVSLASDISEALTDTLTIGDTGKQVAGELLSSQSQSQTGSPVVAMNQLQLSVDSVIPTLGLAQAELASLIHDAPFPFSLGPVSDLGKRAELSIMSFRQSLTSVSEMLTLYPLIAGYQEPKNYLVLLQNSYELRPTGGFIGSIGSMKFDAGSMSDFSIQDVYALDGQLKGHVDPPGPIRDLLSEEHWYLRDSNWDPNFPTSATRSAWFYEKESGTPVDGVIAINVPVVTDLLKVTGPITLSDYNDQISADNFFGKSFYYTQHDFFPGSTQKSDFLGTLTRALLNKITSDPSINPVSLFRALTSALSRKDIQLMFTDSAIQELVDHYQWSGRLFSVPSCIGVDEASCVFDPVAAVEANMSVSKVNYFINRSATREVTVAPDGSIRESFSLTLKNTADTATQSATPGLGGGYLAYIRLYTASDAQFSDVSFDGTLIHSRDPNQKGKPTIPYIEPSTGPSNVHTIGMAVGIPPGTEHTVRVTFTRTRPLSFGRGGAVLDLLNYKHPGVSDETMTTIVHYPIYWVVKDEGTEGAGASHTFVAKDGQVEYNTTIQEDQLIRLRFLK